jgi:hypothetical protein
MHTGPPEAIGPNLVNTYKALENAYVRSIHLGDVDVLRNGLQLGEQPKNPLRIVVGTKAGALSGRVVDDRGQARAGATVVLIPEGDLRFRVRHPYTSSRADGGFQLAGIAPGAYKLFAWKDVDTFAWQDPDFVRPFEIQGRRIEFKEGQVQESGNIPVIP